MPETESVRIEIGFEGGQIMGTLVPVAVADQLEAAVAGGSDGTLALDAAEGRYTVALRRIVYVKRFAREGRVGFGI